MIVAELPRNAMGKVQKNVLRAQLLDARCRLELSAHAALAVAALIPAPKHLGQVRHQSHRIPLAPPAFCHHGGNALIARRRLVHLVRFARRDTAHPQRYGTAIIITL